MRTINHIVKDPQGMHARPAGALVKEAKQYESSIIIKAENNIAEFLKKFLE